MADDPTRDDDRRSPVGRTFDRGLGAIHALREAFNESIEEARDRGELSTDRAKEILTRTFDRARAKEGGAEPSSEKTPSGGEPVSRADFEMLQSRIERLEAALGLGRDGPGPG